MNQVVPLEQQYYKSKKHQLISLEENALSYIINKMNQKNNPYGVEAKLKCDTLQEPINIKIVPISMIFENGFNFDMIIE